MADAVAKDLLQRGMSPVRLSPFNSVRIETIVGRALGVLSVLFVLQCVPVMIAQAPALHPFWGPFANGLTLIAVAALAAAVFSGRIVKPATVTFALGFLGALVAWPGLVVNTELLHGQAPWLWYLCTIATAAAAVGLSLLWAAAYTLAVPVIFGVIRADPSGGDALDVLAALDGLYAVILGGVVLIIITMLRHAAVHVDRAQEAALEAYATAVGQHATELERVQVDSIVHDSVLTTLLAAAGSRTPEQFALAGSMAAGAIARLDAAGVAAPPLDAEVALARIAKRLVAAAQAFSAPIEIRTVGVREQQLPLTVGEALYSATVQAMVNSLQHAGDGPRGIHRSVTIFGRGPEGCRIEIVDNGRGFEETLANRDRLGLRISIRERVHNVGGIVEVRTAPGLGTALAFSWSTDTERA